MIGGVPQRWAVDVRGLVKAFDHRPVLRGVDLRVHSGETLAILGANGSGKTTLLRLIATLSLPTRGSVAWFGEPSGPLPEIRRRIGLVPHESLLYDALTVEENLKFFGGLYDLAPEVVESALDEYALRPLARRRVRVLSRGQRQQVNLARALLHEPDLLILDEPYTGLDVGAADRLTATLRAGAARGCTVILTTHDPTGAGALGADVAVMLDGRLTEIMPAAGLNAELLAAWFREGRR
ncbi:MAG: heme ABC exporter ATP-binding protein CcmA [bacterium]|nr:heme ABC exporter ATP-binding protein CcmA [bacterium]